ncbi:hypothetical protein HPP92_026714 [Vanilla planifolia]|uniref:Uncharacterized protein n=1 Tax=Vanilla planifolia TaxID=51239 RepID=A0A835PB96_VANPL|nr:hypothetical protein HPP92_026714 [Vanilla planifolia]
MSSPSNKEKRNHNGGFNRCFLSSVADVACATPSFSVVGRVYYDARCTGFEINIAEYISEYFKKYFFSKYREKDEGRMQRRTDMSK